MLHKSHNKADSINLSDAPQTVLSADNRAGMGTWTTSFGTSTGTDNLDTNKNIKLHVPAESKKSLERLTVQNSHGL
ncbi:WxL domain-containing protein [Listeria grandensis]